MKAFFTKKVPALFTGLMILSLMGCGSDDAMTPNPDPDPDPTPTNPDPGTPTNTLTANAGADLTLEENTLVTLDGSGSSDSSGGTFNYLWEITSQPAGSTADLSDNTTASPSFTPDTSGMYTVQLSIANTDFESTDTVTITATAAATGTVEIGGNIREDLVLRNLIDTPGVPDYCITSSIDLDAVMTIEPGVELHFDADLSFLVGESGVLIAKGTAEDHIVFTAKDQNAPWRGIGIVFSDDFRNAMDYVDISYAGADTVSRIDRKAGLGISSFSTLSFTNSSITHSSEFGMFVDDNVDLTGFENNRFENNAKAPLVIAAELLGVLDTASQFGTTNGEDMIEVISGIIDVNDEVLWKPMDDGTPFFVNTNIITRVGTTLNILPGSQLYFEVNTYIQASGPFIANGTAENPILFTAKDTSLPWRGIGIFSDNFRNIINHATISYAGIEQISNIDGKAALGLNSFDSLTLTNTLISHSFENGMIVNSSAELSGFENNRFENNAGIPLIMPANRIHQLDDASQFGTTNGTNYIEALGGTINFDDEITWKAFADGTPYRLIGNLTVSSGLNIQPNVSVLVNSNLSIRVGGGFLSAKGGSAAGRITFTAFDQTLPWQGISISTGNVRNELDFVEVSYAGSDQLSNTNTLANVGVGAFDQLKLTNSIISNGLGFGVSLDDTSEVNADIETSNTFSGNVSGNIFLEP